MREFIREKLGNKYVEARSIEFAKSFEESSNATPIFFILSPGVDPLKDVEKIGKKLGFSSDQRNFHNVSLGQGQEAIAESAIEEAARYGHWVILQVRKKTEPSEIQAEIHFFLMIENTWIKVLRNEIEKI
jgi:dynein heavy chain